MNNFELKRTEKKDHYKFFANGVDIFGEQERSTIRHIIQILDNGINTGI